MVPPGFSILFRAEIGRDKDAWKIHGIATPVYAPARNDVSVLELAAARGVEGR